MPTIPLKITGAQYVTLASRARSIGMEPIDYATRVILDSIAPKTVTLAEVAREARVSPMTASYAVNDIKGMVSEEAQKKVFAAVKKLGYQPSLVARAVRGKRVTPTKKGLIRSKIPT